MPTSWINTKTLQVDGDTGLTASQPVAETVKLGIDLSAADKQVLFWGAAATQFQGSANLTYDTGADSLVLGTATKLAFSTDLFLVRDAANVLAQRNGTAGQVFRVYNTYTSGSVFEAFEVAWSTNICTLRTRQAGATARNLNVVSASTTLGFGDTNTTKWSLASGVFRPNTDAALDIGIASTARVRSIYLGGAAASIPLNIKLGATPTAQAMQVLTSTNGVLCSISKEGNFLAFSGTASLPGIGWTSENATGFYRPGNQQLGLTINGTGKLIFGSSDVTPLIGGGYSVGSSSFPLLYLYSQVANLSSRLDLASAANINWNSDTYLYRDSANNLGMRNGTIPQTFRVYNTYTSGSTYEGFKIGWASNNLYLETEQVGAVTARGIFIRPANFILNIAGDTIPELDNTYSLGTDAKRWLNFRLSGDQVFVGSGAGLPFGSVYGEEIAWTQANAVQNTMYAVSSASISAGPLNLVTNSNGVLTATKAGNYLAEWAVTFESSAINQHIRAGFMVNGATVVPGRHHEDVRTASQELNMSGTAILALAANDTVGLGIGTIDAGTPTITVDTMSLSLVQVGA